MDHPVVGAVREFVDAEVRPIAAALEHEDAYPHDLVARMRELGLFGALVPADYGGLGLSVATYARVIEELCRGWMSLAGVINSHTMAALILLNHGTEAQRQRFLPRFARGQARGGLALTEPHAGTDVQAIRTVATRRGDDYLITGTKLFITNAREGNTLALLALTDPKAEPRHRGMSCFIVEKGDPGFRVAKSIAKLGYKGVDTAELTFEDCVVPAANLVGGIEGRGFKHVMGGLEAGRINIAARAVGVAQAAYDDTVAHLAVRGAEPAAALADMATRVRAARLLTSWAAAMKDRGERCDLEAGMAKLFASESAQEVAVEALRLHGGAGALAALNVERYYRDTPLMIIGEGTNEIQRTIIARSLLERYGERFGALTARDSESADVRQMVMAVRQLVDKQVVPAAQDLDNARAHPTGLVTALSNLGLLGALVDPRYGGLGLDPRTAAMIVEEIAGLGRARGDRGESPDGEPRDRARRGACRARAAAAADDARREPGGHGLRERCACHRHRRGVDRRGRDAARRSRRARRRRLGRSDLARRPGLATRRALDAGHPRRSVRAHARAPRSRRVPDPLHERAHPVAELPRRRDRPRASGARTAGRRCDGGRAGSGGFRVGAPLRAAAHDLRQADCPAPGDPAGARGHGDEDHGGAAARL